MLYVDVSAEEYDPGTLEASSLRSLVVHSPIQFIFLLSLTARTRKSSMECLRISPGLRPAVCRSLFLPVPVPVPAPDPDPGSGPGPDPGPGPAPDLAPGGLRCCSFLLPVPCSCIPPPLHPAPYTPILPVSLTAPCD